MPECAWLAPSRPSQVIYSNADGTKTASTVSASASPSVTSSADPSAAPAGGWTEKSEPDPESFAASAGAANLVTVPVDGSHFVSFGVTYSLVTAGGRQARKMTLDSAWLDSKSRVYPVTVDPSIDDATANGTTYVLSPYDNDYSGGSEIDVGTYDGGANVARSYLDFSGVASGLKNDTVLGAYLNRAVVVDVVAVPAALADHRS